MRTSKTVTAGGGGHIKAAVMGGDTPIVIQTMWKERLTAADLEGGRGGETVARIERLAAMGCGLLRFAVPAPEDAGIVGRLAGMVSMPLCADIHFDYKIALRCLDFPIAKLRLNPGNIGGKDRVRRVLEKAGKRGVPIRIGVNAGSLPMPLRKKVEGGEMPRRDAMVEAALSELAVFDEFGFGDVVVSMKASGIADTIKANTLFRERSGAPLHIGVTEAGPLVAGTARNTAALIPLLLAGIGDTVRVSLSGSMENEVLAAREILNAAADIAADADGSGGVSAGRLKRRGVSVVSCPLCGRNSFDTHAFTGRWMERLYALPKDCVVAVMGCAVNGPGEARQAGLGITGAGNKTLIFRHGKVIRTIDADEADRAFEEELLKL